MTNAKSTKRALLFSIVSLLLCFAMLVGTTFAWFTDSAVSANNIIQSGTLDVEMAWAEGTSDPASATWKDASEGAIFDYDKWEPGFVQVRHVRISNKGTLALKYKVIIEANETVSKLADVIDVYYFDPAEQIGNRSQLVEAKRLGTLTEVLANLDNTGNGTLLEGEADTITIAFKMQETAGNEYQGLSLGSTFSIKVLATQLTAEEDSFNDQYDKDAKYPEISSPVKVPTNATAPIVVETKKETATPGSPAVQVAVEIPAQIVNALPDGVESIALAHTEPKVDNATNTVTFDAVEIVDQNGKIVDLSALEGVTEDITVTLPIADPAMEGKTVAVFHDGEYVCDATVTGGKVTYQVPHLCEITVTAGKAITDEASLRDAVAAGGEYVLAKNITVDADQTITVAEDKAVIINLNGKTITAITDDADKNDDGKLTSADNEVVFDVRGTLTVKNGTITIEHKSLDFSWNACTEVFYVGFNGTLNVENATIENKGGSAMAYAIDLVNATNVTLNVTDSTLKSSYIPVRVFNNGAGMNNVTIKGTELIGTSRAFWVHIYSSKDNGGKGIKDATLNLNIYGNGNTFVANNPNRIIEFGFEDEINFDADGNQLSIVTVKNTDELVAAINNKVANANNIVYLEEGDYALRFTNNTSFNVDGMRFVGVGDVNLAISSTEVWYGRILGNGVIFENINFTSGYVGATGEATYNNCTFAGWLICASSNNEKTYVNDCTVNGCLNTSTDFSSGDIYVNNSNITKAEYSGASTIYFEDCVIGELISWNMSTVLTNCTVTTLDDTRMTTNTITVK